MAAGRISRAQVLDQVERVVAAARRPATAAELATRTGLHLRTIYRILASLPGEYVVEVAETPREGQGRPTRRYSIRRREAGGWRTALDELKRVVDQVAVASSLRTVRGLQKQLVALLQRLESSATAPRPRGRAREAARNRGVGGAPAKPRSGD